jgi:hypothetical protein
VKSGEKGDPPIRCTITDISSGGCFLRTDSPFPLETRVELFLCVTDCRVRTEGKIRVMHPEFCTGVEFSSKTQEHRSLMEEIIARLTLTEDLVPEVLVEPEGLDWGNDVEALSGDSSVPAEMEELARGPSIGVVPHRSSAAEGAVSGGTGEAATAVSRSLHGQLARVPNCSRRRHSRTYTYCPCRLSLR